MGSLFCAVEFFLPEKYAKCHDNVKKINYQFNILMYFYNSRIFRLLNDNK